jgi:hypothetical protein
MMPQDFPQSRPESAPTDAVMVLAWPRSGTDAVTEMPTFGPAVVVNDSPQRRLGSPGASAEELMSAINGLTVALQSLRQSLQALQDSPAPPARRPRRGIHA